MKSLGIGLVLTASIISAHEAAATPINITANRYIQLGSDISGPIDGPLSPSTALGSFVDSLTLNLGDEEASADQDSNIAGSSFSGSGGSSIGFSVIEDENVSALSFFDVFFDLTSNHSYSLNGELLANVDGGRGLASFDLSGPGGFSFSAPRLRVDAAGAVRHSGPWLVPPDGFLSHGQGRHVRTGLLHGW